MQTGNRCGFTLIELLIVIGILAALTGMALPFYTDFIGQSKRAVMESNFHALRKALMEYHADTGKYPADANELSILTQGPNRYLLEIPVDPEPSTSAEPVPASWGYTLSDGQPAWGAKYQKLLK